MANVAAPPLRPPGYSLLIAAREVANEQGFRFDPYGIKWTPAACDNQIGPGPDTCDLTAQEDAFGSSISPDVSDDCEEQTFKAIPLWAGYRVSAFSDDVDYQAEVTILDNGEPSRPLSGNERKALDRLAATESFQLAKELWAGAVAVAANPDLPNNYFAKAGSSSVITGVQGVPESVGVLDRELGECLFGVRGMVHVTPRLLASWVANSVVTRVGNLWVTPIGNVVVADAGYPGTAPSGSSSLNPNYEWAFATGMVDVRLDAVQFLRGPGSFHRRTNTYELRAQRLGAAYFDPCCVLAVQVDPCADPCGT